MMEVRDWLLTISMIGHFSYTAWAYVERRSDKTTEKITALTEQVSALDKDLGALVKASLPGKVDQLDRDVAKLTASAKAAPSHADLGDVYEAISKLATTVNQLVGENRGQSDTLRLIQNHIMQKGLRND